MTAREGWRDEALCRNVNPDVFFPPPGGTATEAKRICSLCSVKDECLEFVMRLESKDSHLQSGVYAGLSPKERSRLRNAS
jgi:hypothetical protein